MGGGGCIRLGESGVNFLNYISGGWGGEKGGGVSMSKVSQIEGVNQ